MPSIRCHERQYSEVWRGKCLGVEELIFNVRPLCNFTAAKLFTSTDVVLCFVRKLGPDDVVPKLVLVLALLMHLK